MGERQPGDFDFGRSGSRNAAQLARRRGHNFNHLSESLSGRSFSLLPYFFSVESAKAHHSASRRARSGVGSQKFSLRTFA